jgi:predicted nucleic acid-binding protein
MNVVDSSAWLSYFAGDKNSGQFARAIESIDKLLVPSITLTEVFKSILRQRNEEAAFEAIAHMEQGTVIPLNSELAVNAASFGVEFKLPLADSIIYATARKYEATVWTQDADFDGLSSVKFYPKVNAT